MSTIYNCKPIQTISSMMRAGKSKLQEQVSVTVLNNENVIIFD